MLLLDGIGGCNYFLVINGQPQQGFGGDLTELKGHILVVGPVFQALPQSGEPDLVFQHDAHISCQKATQQCDHRETEEKGVQQLTYNEIQREKKDEGSSKNKKKSGVPSFIDISYPSKCVHREAPPARSGPLSKSTSRRRGTDVASRETRKVSVVQLRGKTIHGEERPASYPLRR